MSESRPESMVAKKPRILVSPEELRQLFNREQFWERAKDGQLVEKLDSEGHPSPRHSGEPPCTRSQHSIPRFERASRGCGASVPTKGRNSRWQWPSGP